MFCVHVVNYGKTDPHICVDGNIQLQVVIVVAIRIHHCLRHLEIEDVNTRLLRYASKNITNQHTAMVPKGLSYLWEGIP